MAMKRINIGSICKSKDASKADYIKVNLRDKGSITLKHDDYVLVESAKFQRESVQAAFDAGKVNQEVLEKTLARIDKIPDFVRAELVVLRNE